MECSSELVDVNAVTNEVNQTQNYVTHIALVVVNLEDQYIVEYVTDGFFTPINMDNISTQNNH